MKSCKQILLKSAFFGLSIGLLGCAQGADAFNRLGIGDAGSWLQAFKKGAKAVEGLDERQEYYLGRAVSAQLLSKYKLMPAGAATSYVNRVARTLAAHSVRPETYGGYKVGILDSAEVNAVSAPGGLIFITRGLLRRCADEDALAGVLAHEIAHVVQGHATSAISQANMTSALLTVGKQAASSYGNDSVQLLAGTLGDSVNEVMETLLTKGFSRSQEYDADEYAAQLMLSAGYNPQGLSDMLLALERAAPKGKQDDAGWYSTHPAPEDRRSNLGDEAKPVADAARNQALRAKRFKAAIGSI